MSLSQQKSSLPNINTPDWGGSVLPPSHNNINATNITMYEIEPRKFMICILQQASHIVQIPPEKRKFLHEQNSHRRSNYANMLMIIWMNFCFEIRLIRINGDQNIIITYTHTHIHTYTYLAHLTRMKRKESNPKKMTNCIIVLSLKWA